MKILTLSVWTVSDRPFWSAYLADIFAEVHLTISMNYFLLEAKVSHLFVFPFHHDIVGTKFVTLVHANYITVFKTYAILGKLPVHKRFEMI